MEEQLCRLLGYLLGDASLKIKKIKNTRKIQTEVVIETADKAVTKDFSETCRKLLKRDVGRITSRKRSERWRKTYCFSCKINKEWRQKLFKLSPTYRTKPIIHNNTKKYPDAKIPVIVFKNKNNMRNFLQAFVNSEGSVQLRVSRHDKSLELMRYVKISCSHPRILNSASDMLKAMSINNRKAPLKNSNSLIIQQKDSLRQFSKEIGFMKGIKVSRTGRWGGYEKRDILNLLIKTFDMKRGHLQHHNNESDVYRFLRNQLPSGNGF
jgi:hypothetical protein